ncbi:flavin reductase family protein [Jatrophihabitans sp.]|uniref:flavin reductase family protein n=1 Tax=Jatrophihabitans sp. TaxID=1932789 RepID=UPI002BB63FC1|nr:flavin reductase family protein [Jatrophihabitans sp.]
MSEDVAAAFRPDLRGPDADLFRHVLGHYPTGVAVITGYAERGPVGMSMNSFTSLSLHPPLVLFCPATSSSTWPILREIGNIAINVLSAGQEALSRKFATRVADRFGDESWSVGENGAPLLHHALGWLECSVRSEVLAGDHSVVIAEIERMNVHWEITEPLVFFRGRYYHGMVEAVESEDTR